MMQDNADETIDLTDDSETIFMQQHVYCTSKNNNKELQFPTQLVMHITPEWFKDLPQDIDCIKIYKMKCLLREWVQKRQNLRYFRMHSFRTKG